MNANLPSISEILRKRKRSSIAIEDYIINDLGIISENDANKFLENLLIECEKVKFNYDDNFFDALERVIQSANTKLDIDKKNEKNKTKQKHENKNLEE